MANDKCLLALDTYPMANDMCQLAEDFYPPGQIERIFGDIVSSAHHTKGYFKLIFITIKSNLSNMTKTTKGRINLAKNPEDILTQTATVYTKHQADGERSVLKTMEDYNWDVIGPKVAIAQQHHDDALRYKGLMEEAYRERDKYMPELDDANRATAGFLKSVNRKNPKRLTEWGYEVNDTPPAAKKQPPKE